MFTGLIERIGKLDSVKQRGNGLSVLVRTGAWPDPLQEGESIAVNGVCLTVAKIIPDGFEADVLKETLSRTNLGSMRGGSPVNLERALRLSSRLGGHMVTGHIDLMGLIADIRQTGGDYIVRTSCSGTLMKEIVVKGSVALNGISLTVTNVNQSGWFEVHVIPHTWTHTSLAGSKAGDRVNIETDIIAKYVGNLYQFNTEKPSLTDQMKKAGFPLTNN